MHYADLNLPILECRTDWITCSARRGDRADGLLEYAEAFILDERAAGDKLTEWYFKGYKGFQAGRIRWGWGKNGGITVWSGELAHVAAGDLAKKADHWSRVDYCVTVWDEADTIQPAEDYWQVYVQRYPDGESPVRLSRLQDFGRGQTCSLGARTAATYLRVYDKFAESKGDYARGCWRWELELKREQAEAQQKRWLETIVVPHYISGLVAGWGAGHYLEAPWRERAVYEPCGQRKVERDADRTLAWLETQVQPSVEWVSQARGEAEVKRVLGLR